MIAGLRSEGGEEAVVAVRKGVEALVGLWLRAGVLRLPLSGRQHLDLGACAFAVGAYSEAQEVLKAIEVQRKPSTWDIEVSNWPAADRFLQRADYLLYLHRELAPCFRIDPLSTVSRAWLEDL